MLIGPRVHLLEIGSVKDGMWSPVADVLLNTDLRNAREVAQQIVLQFKLATRSRK